MSEDALLYFTYTILFSRFSKIYTTKPFIDIRCTLHLLFILKAFFFHTKKYVWSLKREIHNYFNVLKYFLKVSKLIDIDGETTTQVLESIEKKKDFYFLKRFNNGIMSKLAWYKI
jgi:hypothetical protein